MSKKRIIIVGGGFGGVKCAETLCRRLPAEQVEVVLFNRENHLVFSPLLAEVVGSSITPLDVVVPLRQLLPRVYCRTEDVRSIDQVRNEIECQSEDGQVSKMAYDHLVLACGNVTNLNVVPGMADHGFPLKTVGDAVALRSQIMEQMERAEVCGNPERLRWYLTVLIVGGGYSGVEAAGEINDLLRDSARYFRNWREEDISVTLIHARDQILPEISPGLREFARRKMEKAGVKMMLNARVSSATPDGVAISGGTFVRGGTIVCTIGTSSAPVVERLENPKEKGRLATEPDMRLRGSANVWAIGDCAHIINAQDGQPSPTTGQFAERQGRQCAENIVRTLKGEKTKPFSFKLLGELCSIGGHSAVADFLGMHLSGFVAWFIWRGVYLFKLPTIGRRLQVGFDWAWLLIFPRDLAHVRTKQTDRVTHAHYDAGEFVFRKGEPPSNFYVVERGEVEVLRDGGGSDGQVVAVLGAGSFFGERALMSDRTQRMASVRARTNLEVLVMGKNVFTQISGALAPLKEALSQALNRRAVDIWKDQPKVKELLERTPLRAVMEPVPQPLLTPATTLREAGRAFVEHGHEFFFVSSDGQTLEGVVTITDLVRGRSAGGDPGTPVVHFMTKNPVALGVDDNCAIASMAIREYRLKNLPVIEGGDSRKIVGCVRLRKLMAFVIKEMEKNPEAQAQGAKA